MKPRSPGLLKTLRLLAGVNLRRTTNRLLVVFTKRSKGKRRSGTAQRPGFGGALLLIVLALCIVNFGFMAYQVFSRVATVAEHEVVRPDHREDIGHVYYRALRRLQDVREREVPGSPKFDALIELQMEVLRNEFPETIHWVTPDGPAQIEREVVVEQYRAFGLDGFSESGYLGHSVRETLWPTTETARDLFEIGATIVLTLLLIALTLSTLGSGNLDLGRVEWSLEWLFTFPASTRVLVTAKLLEYALVSPILWFAIAPTIAILGYTGGMSMTGALVTALLGVTVFGLLLASARLTTETALRQRLPLARLKNVQAACTLLGMAGMFVILYLAVARQPPTWIAPALHHVPASIAWLPTGLLVRAARTAAFSAAWWTAIGISLATSAMIGMAAVALCARLLRDGLLTSANVRSGTRGAPPAGSRWRPIGVFKKELLLLVRDRNFLVQTTVVPAFIIAWQFIANPGLLDAAKDDPRHAAAMAFGVGAYVLMFGAMATFGAEGPSLWLLYTLPHRMDEILRQKTLLWAGIALFYTVAMLALVFVPTGTIGWDIAIAAFPAMVGVGIYAYVAAGMGVLGWAPDLKQTGRRVRTGAAYAYMLLAACYAYGIYAPDPWTRVVILFLCALLAYALWMKVRDRLPLVLDPTELPPPTITLSDGVTAAFLFFVLQGLLLVGLSYAYSPSTPVLYQEGRVLLESSRFAAAPVNLLHVLLAFAGAGSLVVLGTFFVLRRRQMPDILGSIGILVRGDRSGADPRDATDGWIRRGDAPWLARASLAQALLTGAVGGILCGILGRLYLIALYRFDSLAHLRVKLPTAAAADVPGKIWVVILAVVVAPIFEEFLFRGLLYQGLRRSFGLLCSLLTSAAVFAVVHPAVSVLPVFAMGLVAALVFERTRSLPAAMLVHAVYNAMVVSSQL